MPSSIPSRLSQCDALHQPEACRTEPLLALPRRPDRRFLSMDRHTARYPLAFTDGSEPVLSTRPLRRLFIFLSLRSPRRSSSPTSFRCFLRSRFSGRRSRSFEKRDMFPSPHGLPSLLCPDDRDRHQPRAAHPRRPRYSEIRHFLDHPLCSLFCSHAVKGAYARLPLSRRPASSFSS